MKVGARVMCLDHPAWVGGKLQGYEGELRGVENGLYVVQFPFLKRLISLPRVCVCPVYRDCETCGYGAWKAIEVGKVWRHFCAWHSC